MALIELGKDEGFAFWRKASARPESRKPWLKRATDAFTLGREPRKGFDGPEKSGDHISLMKKHPKLFG